MATRKPTRTPPAAHPDHGKAIYRCTARDDDGKRYELTVEIDMTEIVPLLNAMVLTGASERKLRGTPFTVRQRRLADDKTEVEAWRI